MDSVEMTEQTDWLTAVQRPLNREGHIRAKLKSLYKSRRNTVYFVTAKSLIDPYDTCYFTYEEDLQNREVNDLVRQKWQKAESPAVRKARKVIF